MKRDGRFRELYWANIPGMEQPTFSIFIEYDCLFDERHISGFDFYFLPSLIRKVSSVATLSRFDIKMFLNDGKDHDNMLTSFV